jgi:hypothetical protein
MRISNPANRLVDQGLSHRGVCPGFTGDLEDPSFLFFTVGGARTHYPRPGNQQAGLPVTSGLLPTHMAHIPHGGEDTSVTEIVLALGLNDSEWFDPHDVEGYLRSMGIFLEDHTSFVEFPIPANQLAASNVAQSM